MNVLDKLVLKTLIIYCWRFLFVCFCFCFAFFRFPLFCFVLFCFWLLILSGFSFRCYHLFSHEAQFNFRDGFSLLIMFRAAHKQCEIAILILINTSVPNKFRMIIVKVDNWLNLNKRLCWDSIRVPFESEANPGTAELRYLFIMSFW